jgi:hypothetical protein
MPPLKRQKRLPGRKGSAWLRARSELEHGVHHHLELGDVLLLDLVDGVVDLADISDEIVDHLELGFERADAEEIVVGVVALGIEHGVGGADHLLAHVPLLALAVERVGDEGKHQRALAHAELVGEEAQPVPLESQGLEAPGLVRRGQDVGEGRYR